MVFVGNVLAEPTWQLYDDFNSGVMDWGKWTYDPDPGEIATVNNGQMRLSVTQQAGKENTDTEARIIANVTGVKADMQLLSTTTAIDGGVKLMVSLNGGEIEAGYGIWRDEYDQSSIFLVGAIHNEADETDYYPIFEFGQFASNTTYTLAIMVSSSSIEFYVNGILRATYTGQNGVASPPYSVKWIGFESRTYTVGDFVDGRVDNVYITVCPSADLTGDCFVDLADLAIFAQQWLTGTR